MKFYNVNEKNLKIIHKHYIKNSINEYGRFVKFSFVFEKILTVTGIILAILNLINVIFISHEPLFLLFLIMTAGFPYGISLIFRAVYNNWVLKKYKFRGNERLGLDKDTLQYTYDDYIKGVNNSYIVKVQDISCVEYYKNKHEVVVTGKIKHITAAQEEKPEEVEIDTIDFLNIFNKDFIEWSKQNNVNVKEI